MPGRSDTLVWDTARLDSPHTQADKGLRVRRMFDRIARTYELVNRIASAGRDARWREELVRRAGVCADDVVLDIACGTGDVARALARPPADLSPPRHIVGLDFSWPMLALAAERPVHGGHFIQGDALALPLPSASVSMVSCAFGIRNFASLERGFTEMYRVLAPGGRAALLEFSLPTGRVLRRLYSFYLLRILPLVGTVISGERCGAYRYLPHSVISFDHNAAIQAKLMAVGFAPVTVHPLSWGIVAIYLARKSPSVSL